MFGKILKVLDNSVFVQNISNKAETGLIGYHVNFIEGNKNIVGEIINLDEKEIEINLLGEIVGNMFVSGALRKPSTKSSCRIITKNELEYILGKQNFSNKENVYVGESSIYPGFKVTANLNELFASHFAVLGNSGSGKSCSVSRILQNIFYYNDEGMPVNSHFVIFDVFGEYRSALEGINNLPNMGFKSYTTEISNIDNNLINIPAYFLGVDDLALLLDVDDPTLLPVLENTLRLTYVLTGKGESNVVYKNRIIANTLMDILSSGRNSNQVRDQIIATLTKYNTVELNLDTVIHQPGYDRTLRQCLNIDNQGKINAIGLVIDFLGTFADFDMNKLDITKNFVYTLDDLAYALDFSLVNEGVLSSNMQFEKLNKLKVRLDSIINSDYKKFFEFTDVISKNEYVEKFFTTERGTKAQVVNMNFNYVDDRMVKTLTKIYAKLFFDYVTNLENRASFPIHLILEEAHRYVSSDSDIKVLGYNIFDRITKEGRKYGVILGLITQRPSELSTTSLSQCANFIVLKLYYPDDLNIIKSITSNVSGQTLDKIKSLRPGMALCFGNAFKIPLIVELPLPDPMPKSTSVDISKTWY